jgi:hypothetical protein
VNSVLTPPRRRSVRRAGAAIVIIICSAVVAAVLLTVSRLGGDESTSNRRLTVENRLPYIVNVEVTGGQHDGWLSLGSFRRESRRIVEEVADQGDQWVFRFSYAGVDAGELVVTRQQLVNDGWKIIVPPEVGERLRQAGLSESAP